MKYCFYLDWNGFTSSEWAAWVQAVGSVVAIVAAALFPLWHQKIESRRKSANYVRLITHAELLADRLNTQLAAMNPQSLGRADEDELRRLFAVFGALPYHDLPTDRLMGPLKGAEAMCECLVAIAYRANLDANQGGQVQETTKERVRNTRAQLTSFREQAAGKRDKPIVVTAWRGRLASGLNKIATRIGGAGQ